MIRWKQQQINFNLSVRPYSSIFFSVSLPKATRPSDKRDRTQNRNRNSFSCVINRRTRTFLILKSILWGLLNSRMCFKHFCLLALPTPIVPCRSGRASGQTQKKYEKLPEKKSSSFVCLTFRLFLSMILLRFINSVLNYAHPCVRVDSTTHHEFGINSFPSPTPLRSKQKECEVEARHENMGKASPQKWT